MSNRVDDDCALRYSVPFGGFDMLEQVDTKLIIPQSPLEIGTLNKDKQINVLQLILGATQSV
jgi:hypothetical protein